MRLNYLTLLNNILDFMSPNFIVGNHHQIHKLTFPFMLQGQDALGRTYPGQITDFGEKLYLSKWDFFLKAG